MRIFARTLAAVAAIFAAFAWWGLFTSGGNRTYDEMHGMIPFGAGLLASLLFIAAGIAGLIARRGRS
jgi:hypothetical protein